MSEELLRTLAMAAMLDISETTAAIWRCKKIGPPFIVLNGGIRYRRAAVEKYLEDHTIVPGAESNPKIKRRPGGTGRPRGLGRAPQKRRKAGGAR